MASISDLPADLKDLARQMPDGLLGDLHQGEAEHRLRHVDNMLRAAESLPHADHYRSVTASARRHLKAMPNAQFVAERNRLKGLISDASSAGHSEVAEAFREGLRKLEDDHPQVPGVQEAIMAHDKAQSDDVTKGKAAARAAAIQRELAKARVRLEAEQERIRAEIEQFKRERGL